MCLCLSPSMNTFEARCKQVYSHMFITGDKQKRKHITHYTLLLTSTVAPSISLSSCLGITVLCGTPAIALRVENKPVAVRPCIDTQHVYFSMAQTPKLSHTHSLMLQICKRATHICLLHLHSEVLYPCKTHQVTVFTFHPTEEWLGRLHCCPCRP